VNADTTLVPVFGHPVSRPPDRRSDQVAFSRADKESGARRQGLATRGQLRIYLSFATGAGRTCALLSEGHRLVEYGIDVVVASAQTHGRPYTADLLEGLEVIPPTKVAYRGTVVEEMNLGAVLARRPAVALVDDFAHSNVPGLRHAKRWQDVEDLLEAGIDAISTVNIEHLDSRTDVVEKITGVSPSETVPDRVVRAARELEMVDVAPEALRDRMAQGHIYPAQRVPAVLDGWFQTGNLSVLREVALRWVAGKLANEPQGYRVDGQVRGSGYATERVVVALGGGPEGEMLIRRASRIAERSGGDLLAVHVALLGRLAAARATLASQQQLIRSLGGTYHQLADTDIPAALLAFAHAENATQLVLGATHPTRLSALRPRTNIRSQVIHRGGGIDVHVVTCTPTT
jgi:two-component system, OmpR family, sensor histidine kinase KdpD